VISLVDRARKDAAWWRESDSDGQAVSSDVQTVLDLGVWWPESCHQRYVPMTLSVVLLFKHQSALPAESSEIEKANKNRFDQ